MASCRKCGGSGRYWVWGLAPQSCGHCDGQKRCSCEECEKAHYGRFVEEAASPEGIDWHRRIREPQAIGDPVPCCHCRQPDCPNPFQRYDL